MNIREFTCLVRLFQACRDQELRRRAIELVPELEHWNEPPAVLRVIGSLAVLEGKKRRE
jgi:hypothetical protein